TASETVAAKNLTASETVTAKTFTASETVAAKNLTASETVTTKNLTASETVTAKNLTASETVAAKTFTASETVTAAQRLGVGKTSPTCALDVQGDIQASGRVTASGITFQGDLTSANGLFTLEMRDHHTYAPSGTPFQYPVLHLKGAVLTSDVKARNAIACSSLDVKAVAGDPARTGMVTCSGLGTSGAIIGATVQANAITASDSVAAARGVTCCKLDVRAAAGDPGRPGTITCAGRLTATAGLSFDADLCSTNNNFVVDPRGYVTCAGLTTGGEIRASTIHAATTLVADDGVRAYNVIATSAIEFGSALRSANGTLVVDKDGNVTCTKLIATTGIKQFQIDHPLDPEHKTLAHAALEGPEAGVYYRGEGQLAAGRAVVALPAYFEALTRKEGRTVMITPRCEGDDPISPLAATAITEGRFLVRAITPDNPSQRFYWEVKAVRGDVPALEVELRKDCANGAPA
ncbi:MAG TPA: hypothetical protein VFK02_00925, partial [Kofleriaceae bacterium]|nr:hypothetical protein [Kofleriaceae bacterium]